MVNLAFPVRTSFPALHSGSKRNFCLSLTLLLYLILFTRSVSPVSTAEKWTRRLRHVNRSTHSSILNTYHLVTKRTESAIPSCRDPGTPENGIRGGTTFTVGSELVFKCKAGFVLRGSEVLTCRYGQLNELYWDANLPQCVAQDPIQHAAPPDPCGTPPEPSTFAYRVSYSVGESVSYSCLDGYVRQSGSEQLTCREGTWEGDLLQCRRLGQCRDYRGIENGRRVLEGISEGDIVTFICNEGFNLLGNRQIQCGSDGNWIGAWPICIEEPAHCGDPGTLANGRRFVGGTTEGSLVRFLCNSGFALIGKDRRTCLPNGEWSGNVPSCGRVSCTSPPSPVDGSVMYDSTIYGSVATYKCNRGHVLTGSISTTCGTEGTWTNPPPTCTRVECGGLRSPRNGVVRVRERMYSFMANYSCLRGYGLVGYPTRTCQADGRWSGRTPSCNSDTCGTLSDPFNGKVTINRMTLGGVALYSCDTGYKLEGYAQRTCGLFGVWSGNPCTCEPITCPDLKPPQFGAIAVTNDNRYASTAEYTCDFGYIMIGGEDVVKRHCQASGLWTGRPAYCYEVQCPSLSGPHNGKVILTGRGLGDEATYSCNFNYQLRFGDEIRSCTETGLWSGSEPCCIRNEIFCPELSDPSNGTVVLTGVQVGDRANYDCDEGFNLISGQSTRMCLSSGAWSGEEPMCGITCPQLSDPANGTVAQDGNRPGDKAVYSCKSGFVLVESEESRTCQEDGEWSGNMPFCQEIPLEPRNCGNLTDPENGVVDTSIGVVTGAIATYSCNEGYILNGDENRTCDVDQDGKWSGNEPSCLPVDCQGLTPPLNGQISYVGGTTLGSTATYSCNEGYDLDGEEIRNCESSGEWSGMEPSCTLRDCGSLSPPTDGTVSVNSTTIGSVALYECDPGYELSGPISRECLNDGVWSEVDPTCELVDCGNLTPPTNGDIILSETTFGSEANYSCDLNYRLEGPDGRECMENGEWSNGDPTCEPVQCPNLPQPDNGLVETPNRTVGSIATYSCNQGYRLIGAMETECLGNEMWSSMPPVCQLITCPSLPPLENGNVVIVSNTVGGQAIYDCVRGLALMGSPTRVCGDNGEWLGEAPVCEVVICPELPPLTNGQVIVNSRTFGSKASYFCDVGYIVDGLLSRLCEANGQWGGDEPVCIKSECDPNELSNPDNGMVTFSSITLGSIATYTCDPGFSVIGSSTRECVHSDVVEWSGMAPTCEQIVCPPLEDPPNVAAIRTFVGIANFGDAILYNCDLGFSLSSGSIRRRCGENGEWDGEEPTCSPSASTVVCPLLTDPERGMVQFTSTIVGSIATYTCDPGYNLDSTVTRECMSNETWSGNEPTCNPVDCGSLTNPVDGMVDTAGGTTLGNVAIYSCMDGYELNGSPIRVCIEDGKWNDMEPTCDAIGMVPGSCGDPGTPVNGDRVLISTTSGSTVEYSCSRGYRLNGMATRICLDNKEWSGEQPTCVLVMCPPLPSPSNGMIFVTGFTVDSAVAYICNNGFSFHPDAAIRRVCEQTGQWSGEEPVCIPDASFTCMPLPLPTNGTVTMDSNTVGSVATYSCDVGFVITGPTSRTCEPGGSWSDFEPVCERIQCADPGIPADGRRVMDDFTAGSRVYFVCNDGFQTQENVVIRCLDDGTWTAPAPTCTAAASAACSGSDAVMDSFGRRCQCVSGQLESCCRYRRDWSTLSLEEKISYINAVKTISSDSDFQPLYNELVKRYKDSFDTIAQYNFPNSSHFFPWHRYFLLEYEDLLRMVDPALTIPYWDWSVMPTMPYQSPVFNPENGFGNSANTTTECVTSGPFQEGSFEVTPSANGGCLMRQYNSFQYPSRSLVENEFLSLGADKFEEFHNSIQLFINLNVRCFVGGHMCTPDAANDPLYLLQLTRIDLILDRWQNLDMARATARYTTENAPLVLTFDNSLVVSDFSDNKDLPYRVCVRYASLQEISDVEVDTTFPSSGPDLPTLSPVPRSGDAGNLGLEE